MAGEFRLDDRQWTAIEAHLPRNRPGARRVDDRRVLGGIIHVLKSGCRWQDCPAVYGPPATIYNRFHRRSGRGLRRRLFQALATVTPDGVQTIAGAISGRMKLFGWRKSPGIEEIEHVP